MEHITNTCHCQMLGWLNRTHFHVQRLAIKWNGKTGARRKKCETKQEHSNNLSVDYWKSSGDLANLNRAKELLIRNERSEDAQHEVIGQCAYCLSHHGGSDPLVNNPVRAM